MDEKRKIGSSLKVTPVGLGCMGFSHAYGAPTERKDYTGVNADDTISYNEELVGEALQDVRERVTIATKFGVQHSPKGLLMDSRPETIRKSVEGSLKRLGVETIDLYYQHRIDPKIEPETVAEVMKELIVEGKIRAWGISEATEDYLRRAHAVCSVSAIQNRYSMLAREHEKIFPVLEELGIAYVAFSPLGNGFLTGQYTAASTFETGLDYRAHMPQYTEEGFKAAEKLMKLLEEMAVQKEASKGQVSLAWMLCKKPYIIPIPGSRKESRIQENLGAKDVVLSTEEIRKMDELLDQMVLPVYGQNRANH